MSEAPVLRYVSEQSAQLLGVKAPALRADPDANTSGRFGLPASAAIPSLFTPVMLHSDLAHLLANVTFGLVILGFAMARFGPGVTLLATYLASLPAPDLPVAWRDTGVRPARGAFFIDGQA